jgi:hypothetical protein
VKSDWGAKIFLIEQNRAAQVGLVRFAAANGVKELSSRRGLVCHEHRAGFQQGSSGMKFSRFYINTKI